MGDVAGSSGNLLGATSEVLSGLGSAPAPLSITPLSSLCAAVASYALLIPNRCRFRASVAMERRTRNGKQFSPFEGFLSTNVGDFKVPGFQVHQLDVSVDDLFLTAQNAADRRSQLFDDDQADPDEDSDWEDIESRPPSPADSASEDSRPCSPFEAHNTRPSSPTCTATTSIGDPEELPEDDMPALLDSPAQRRAARQALYQRQRRRLKRQKLASSPFTRVAHPKHLPTHRMLDPKTSEFDASDFQSSAGGGWLGKRARPPPKRKAKVKRTAQMKARRLRELEELRRLGYQYISWAGK